MDAPRAYGFHSGLPWPHPRVSGQNGDKAGPFACRAGFGGSHPVRYARGPLSPGAKRPGLREERSVHLR
jgi:hypothetical protein